jgi:exodeoxyribonuclease VII small subunit
MKLPKADYQTLKNELDEVLMQLQDESTGIDAALRGYERGLELTRQLEDYLKTAENRIVQLKAKES